MVIPTSKETPEEMGKRIRKEINDEKPESVGSGAGENFDTSGVKTKKTGSIEGMKLYTIIVFVSLIISLLVTTFIGVSPLNKNIAAVNDKVTKDQNDIKTIQTSLGNMQTKLDAAIAGIPSNVSSAIGTQVSTLQTQFGQLQAQVSGFSTSSNSALQKVNDLASQISTLTQNITALQTTVGKVNTTQLSTDLTAAQTAVTALQTQLAVDEANIQKLQASLPSNSTTGTSGLTSTLNGVTASITVTNNWMPISGTTSGTTGMTLIASSSPAYTGSFNIQVNNATGRQANGFSVGVVFYAYDTTSGSYVLLSANPTATLVGNNPTVVWTLTTTTYPYIFGFSNTSVVGLPGLSGWTIPVGVSNYQMNFTLTNPASGGTHTYYVVPSQITIIGFTPAS